MIADPILDLDNLISATKSLIDFFWPPDSSNPPPADMYLQRFVGMNHIEKDIVAVCYTFYTLLWLSTRTSIAERKVAMREITSRILGIFPPEHAEFIAGATRMTYKQLYWTCYQLGSPRYEGAMGDAVVSTLRGMRDAVRKRHNYYIVDC